MTMASREIPRCRFFFCCCCVLLFASSAVEARLPPLRGGSSPAKWPLELSHPTAYSKTPARRNYRQPVQPAIVLDDLLDRSSRVAFVRRVYGLLSASLGLSAIASLAGAAYPAAVHSFCSTQLGQLLLALCMAVGFVAPLTLSLAPRLRRDPATSLPIFAAFTAAESALLGAVCASFSLDAVALAVGQTAAALTGLTIWAYQPNPRYDLTQFGSALVAALVVLVLTGVAAAFFHVPALDLAYSALGAIVFSLFIVHDTELVVGGNHRRVQLDTRDYVLGAMTLYIDVANLFMFLLRFAAEAKDRGD